MAAGWGRTATPGIRHWRSNQIGVEAKGPNASARSAISWAGHIRNAGGRVDEGEMKSASNIFFPPLPAERILRTLAHVRRQILSTKSSLTVSKLPEHGTELVFTDYEI
jgi:hypothetical protein